LNADAHHIPVLLEEAVAALAVKPEGVYLDATFGRGGHSRRILDSLGPRGRLIALDRDPDADALAATWSDPRFRFHRIWFSQAPAALDAEGVARIDGALFDVGVSSPQIDAPGRGFSLRADGPLDMRMDTTREPTAAQWLATVSERDLRGVIANYGEERFAREIARAIVAAREDGPIVRTGQLAAIVAKAVGARGKRDRSQDPATRTFQAVRIHVNQELAELPVALEGILPRLAAGGRLAVITFHSLEHRLVKAFFRRHATAYGGDERTARLPIAERSLPVPPLKVVGRAIRPSAAELASNPRSRSAHLRVAQRTEGMLARW
jgi:16S rRNA (cytosine1402-N4)-methyltransferase